MVNEVPHRSVRLGCLLCVALVGCAQPDIGARGDAEVRFVKSRCQRVTCDGHLEALAFSSSFKTHGLDGQQLLYKIVVFGSDRRPIKSVNGVFEDADGNVACSRTLMVRSSPASEQFVSVRLPASELEVDPSELPVFAQMGVYLPDQRRLAWHRMRLPYRRSDNRRPPKPAPHERAEEILLAPRDPVATHSEPSIALANSIRDRSDGRSETGKPTEFVSTGEGPRVSLPDGLPTPVHPGWRQIVPRFRDGVAFFSSESRPRHIGGNP